MLTAALLAAVAGALHPAATARRPVRHTAGMPRMLSAAEWLTDQGYVVGNAKSSGSSGWASFGKISVMDPAGNPAELFIKTAGRPAKEMFEGEALGLKAMGATKTVRVPKVLHYDNMDGGGSFLIMEYLHLTGSPDPAEFGRQMAKMHLAPPDPELNPEGQFGFPVDNTIGGTPQKNRWREDWVEFFRVNRMDYQVDLAGSTELSRAWQQVKDRTQGLRALFDEDEDVKPSVLHGDLWSGNMAATPTNEPVIFDPATYYGHHEAEWGMSWCASLGPAFWRGYREVIPEAPGFRARRPLYEAYHKINHYNLFGGFYLSDGISLLKRLA